jgi:hypothetical protein
MNLVEAEETGPVEGDEPLVTPPRPPHRRVSVSLVFTLSVLIGTVVTIYTVFPARHNVLVTDAIAAHRDPGPAWDLAAPPAGELRAWAIGVAGPGVPLPPASATVLGARKVVILHRPAALIRLRAGGTELSFLVQHARLAPAHADRVDGDVRAVWWTEGHFTIVVVGPASHDAPWYRALIRGGA